MAIFHFAAQIISKAEGRSAVAAAAYRHAAAMEREIDRHTFNYQAKEGVEHEELTLPPGAPAWANLRYGVGVSGDGGPTPSAGVASARLWNDIEKRENQHSRRATAQLAREIEFSLPVEMTRAEQVTLAREFITNSLAGRGYSCDWVLHAKEGNSHIHVMFSERVLAGREGEWGNKIRTPNRRQQLLDLRAEWAMAANSHLEQGEYEARIDHRSHKDLGLTIEPGVHRGSKPSDPAEHAAWQARVAEDQAIARANGAWLRENPGELVKLARVGHEVVTRPILMEEALKRLKFPDRAAAVEIVEAAIEAGGLVPASPVPTEPSPVREQDQSAAVQEIRVQAPVPAEDADPRSVEIIETAAAEAGWIKNASFALAVGAGERLLGPQPLHAAGSQGEIAKFLALGGGQRSNWPSRLFLERRAETEARAMAEKRVGRQIRRGILADLGIGEDILDAPESWLMISAEKREAYETRTANALAASKAAPTELDRAVARSLAVAEDRGDPELIHTGQALRDVASAAPVRTSAELASDREDVLASLPRTGRVSTVSVFHELHRAFTPDEIDALMTPDKPLPAPLPALPAERRQAIARYLLEQARNLSPSRSIPWASRVRDRVPGLGMDFSR